MAGVHAHIHAGLHPDVYIFERDLIELTDLLGRPRPEVRGTRLVPDFTRELCWQVGCQVRGKEVIPTSEEITFEVMDRTFEDGVMRVLRQSISHLVHHHREEVADTRFEHYAGIDEEGFPFDPPEYSLFGRNFVHTELLLHHTQAQMNFARMAADERSMEVALLREDLQAAIFERNHLRTAKSRFKRQNRRMKIHICKLKEQVASLESHVDELEEEAVELRKENEDLLIQDDDHGEAMDEEPESADDDDDVDDVGVPEVDDCDAVVNFDDPVTPSEEDPEEVVPHVDGDE
jgi:hypothetical protein